MDGLHPMKVRDSIPPRWNRQPEECHSEQSEESSDSGDSSPSSRLGMTHGALQSMDAGIRVASAELPHPMISRSTQVAALLLVLAIAPFARAADNAGPTV